MAHGKSTVVKAISGVQTVRFKNELERNITIKLGYANAKVYRCKNARCPRYGMLSVVHACVFFQAMLPFKVYHVTCKFDQVEGRHSSSGHMLASWHDHMCTIRLQQFASHLRARTGMRTASGTGVFSLTLHKHAEQGNSKQ